eukprot:gene11249-biopygen16852
MEWLSPYGRFCNALVDRSDAIGEVPGKCLFVPHRHLPETAAFCPKLDRAAPYMQQISTGSGDFWFIHIRTVEPWRRPYRLPIHTYRLPTAPPGGVSSVEKHTNIAKSAGTTPQKRPGSGAGLRHKRFMGWGL